MTPPHLRQVVIPPANGKLPLWPGLQEGERATCANTCLSAQPLPQYKAETKKGQIKWGQGRYSAVAPPPLQALAYKASFHSQQDMLDADDSFPPNGNNEAPLIKMH